MHEGETLPSTDEAVAHTSQPRPSLELERRRLRRAHAPRKSAQSDNCPRGNYSILQQRRTPATPTPIGEAEASFFCLKETDRFDRVTASSRLPPATRTASTAF